MNFETGQVRAVVRDIYPCIEQGDYFIKRCVGDSITVWANVYADGHDIIKASLQFKHESETEWSEVIAHSIGADRWSASFQVSKQGFYNYRFAGWADYALYWQYGISKKAEIGLDVRTELMEGLDFLNFLLTKVNETEKVFVNECRVAFADLFTRESAIQLAKSVRLKNLFEKYPYRPFVGYNNGDLKVYVDRDKGSFSTWYEFFPRSASATNDKHGTFKDCIKLLPRVAEFGFDTLYFPPIHPIGLTNRKGKNNTTVADKNDVGSCWGIGGIEGGHKAIHPQLGTLADFKKLIAEAKKLNIEIAMDLALQVTPDHPYVAEHPDWFKQRPDGTIQYAENPPKKYQDIYPIYFESADWKAMWQEFLDVVLYWASQGISIFRVDNPHTKPFAFWEWLIAETKAKHPDILFLSEAFTRPAVMQELAQLGFSQSYTYFTWRNSKHELIEYMNELTQRPTSETFRPNFWPNTPDILPFPLQNSNEATYLTRYFLAATLSSNTGVYGPVYELLVGTALPGREEYHNSEKFEIGNWDWNKRTAVTKLYTTVNHARRRYKALQRTNNITFLHIENDQLLAYLKKGSDGSSVICVVNLDSYNPQMGQLKLHPSLLGLDYSQPIKLTDQITETDYTWHGDSHFIHLLPSNPFHLFVVRK